MKLTRIFIFTVAFILLAGTQGLAKEPKAGFGWNEKIQQFQLFEYKDRSELYTQSKLLLNQIEDDDQLTYQQKLVLRKKVSQIETAISHQLPELKLVGFKKTPIDPSNLKAGYVLEPEYR